MQISEIKNKNQKLKTEFKIRLYKYCLEIIKFLEKLPKDFISQTIGKQLLKSATSIGANYIEAKASSSKRDFLNFFNTALKSANETIFWLCLLRDSGRCGVGINELIAETKEISNILASSILTMKNKKSL